MGHDHHAAGHSHGHAHGHAHDVSERSNIGLAFAMNFAFTLIELVGGLWTNSVAILSDAVHDFGDSLSLALAWYFQRLSKRGRSKSYTYGYKRFSLLGAIVNSIVLVVGSVYIITEAVERLFHPASTSASGMFYLAILGIVVNGAAVLRTRKANSYNERVVSLHLLEDVLGWGAVLVGSAVMWLTGWTVIDPLLSLAVACFVLFNVYKNIRGVMPILLQGTPAEIDRDQVFSLLGSLEGVVSVHDLHIWSLDENYPILTAHLVLAEPLTMPRVADLKRQVRAVLAEQGVHHATIEFETEDEGCTFSDSDAL